MHLPYHRHQEQIQEERQSLRRFCIPDLVQKRFHLPGLLLQRRRSSIRAYPRSPFSPVLGTYVRQLAEFQNYSVDILSDDFCRMISHDRWQKSTELAV